MRPQHKKLYKRGADVAEKKGHEDLIRKVYYKYKKQLGMKVVDKG